MYDGRELTQLKGEELRALRRHFQIIFQDPYASLNPRMLVGEILEEGMRAQGIGAGRPERQTRVAGVAATGRPVAGRASTLST